MTQQASKKKPATTAPKNLSDHFKLLGIRLSESRCKLSLDGDPLPEQVKINIQIVYSEQKATKGIIVRCACDVSTLAVGDKPPAVSIQAAYECLYQANSAKAFSGAKEAIPALSRSAQFHAWPYLRRLIHQTTLEMGVPPIVLPMFAPRSDGDNVGRIGKQELKNVAKKK